MITADDAERALDWLSDHADEAAECRAARVQLEEFSKALKAQLMTEYVTSNPDSPVNAQERYAMSHTRYQQHLEGLGEAVKRDERMRWLRDTAFARIDVFRTQESTKRALKL